MASTPSHHSPSEQTLEMLSALVDDESNNFERKRLLDMDNPELDSKWQSYNLAGALMRKELAGAPMVDLSASISAAIAEEDALPTQQPTQAAQAIKPAVSSWQDWVAKSAIAASVAVAVVAGVQFTQLGQPDAAPGAPQITSTQDPVISAPAGFDLPAPVAQNVSLGNLAEPKASAISANQQQFMSNAQVEAELQQLFLEHAELSSEHGKFGLMPMARTSKMQDSE